MNPLRTFLGRFGLGAKPAAATSKRSYAAGLQDRLTADWITPQTSADAEIRNDLKKLRNRSRSLERDNDYARKYFSLLCANVIGSNGIGLQMKVRNQDGNYDTAANDLIEAAWKKWGKKKNCTVTGRDSFVDVCNIVLRSTARDGFILIRKRKGATGFKLQLIEGDHLDIDYSARLDGGNKVTMGVETNADGATVAYHILTAHPGDSFNPSTPTARRVAIAADEIIFPFWKYRVSQTIGDPWLVTAMRRMNMLGGYEEAELVAARVSACKGGFYKRSGVTSEGLPQEDDGSGQLVTEMQPGQTEELPMGYEFQQYDPTHPNNAFPDFVKANLRGVASGLGVSYTSLSNDLEGVNYSSIRAGLLDERDQWKALQGWFIEQFVSDVFESWLEWEIHTSRIPLLFSDFDRLNAPEWKPRRWAWVDPQKDIEAAKAAIKAGLDSPRSWVAENGGDIEDIYQAIQEDKKLAHEKGLTFEDESKLEFDAFGVAVRAGAITPSMDDEKYFRARNAFPAMNAGVIAAWEKDGGARKPITLVQGNAEIVQGTADQSSLTPPKK